jgi:hypothetical protein
MLVHAWAGVPPDRHTQLLMEIATKKVSDGGKMAGRLGTAFRPRSFHFGEGFHRSFPRNTEEADFREIGFRNFPRTRRRTAERKLHVGLPRADPDFPHEHVVDRHHIVTADLQREGTTGGERLEVDAPFSARSSGAQLLIAEFHEDFFTVARGSPDRNLLVPLKDGPVGKQRIRLHFARQGQNQRQAS